MTKYLLIVAGVAAVAGLLAVDAIMAAGLFLAGAVVGIALPVIEQLALPYIQKVEQSADNRLQAQGAESPEPAVQTGLVTRSIVFLGIYVPLAIYISATTTNRIGHGVLFGIAMATLAEMISVYRNPARFQQTFLWQVNRNFSSSERSITTIVTLSFTLLLAVVILLR